MKKAFDGKAIVVAGASSGLGAELARAFSEQGGGVILFARSESRLRIAASKCKGEPLVVVGDVGKEDDCRRLMKSAASHFGGIDCVVVAAGISMWARFDQIESSDVFRRLMDVNFFGLCNCALAALPYLKERRGMLAAISSIQGRIGVPLHTGYAASKHAVEGFCASLREEVSADGVGVLTVLPHWIRGTMLRENALDAKGEMLGESARRHSRESVDLTLCAEAILRAIRRRDRELIIPFKLRGLLFLYFAFPRLAGKIINRAVQSQRGQ